MTLQTLYPNNASTTFDYDHHFNAHIEIVDKTMGQFKKSRLVSKELGVGSSSTKGYHAIGAIIFSDTAASNPCTGEC